MVRGQAHWRRLAAQRRAAARKAAAVQLQAAARGYLARKALARAKAAACCIQVGTVLCSTSCAAAALNTLSTDTQASITAFVKDTGRQQYVCPCIGAGGALFSAPQAAWRAVQAQRLAAQLRAQRQRAMEHRAAALLQAVVRGHRARQQLVRQNQAATAIQACWRGVLALRSFLQARHAAVRVQAAFR